ncbi:MAG: anaerobic ribonucleoside-triphosphate reductase activating protein [Acutalibacteraceae bacterium]|nr:anaerobic ribonucleoside-triphosphate reductase activating protein [Acutalibacteraceae bacterium]
MNYATIKPIDVANGPGVRVSLFVSGCTHHCKGCFNSEAWDFNYGKPFEKQAEEEIFSALSPDYIEGFSLLGGEPFEPQNQETLLPFLRKLKDKFPNKSIWCYSGYSFEDIVAGNVGDKLTAMSMLSLIDILVDGEFIEEQKDLHLRFRGSANQRVIDVKKSLRSDSIVFWDDELYI